MTFLIRYWRPLAVLALLALVFAFGYRLGTSLASAKCASQQLQAAQAQAAALEAANEAAALCRLMLVVGTSGAVWPAAGLAAWARRSGALVAFINPDRSAIDADAQHLLRGTAAGLLPRVLAHG